MESYLGDLHLNFCIIYLDDIIMYSKTPSENINRLQKLSKKLTDADLKLKPIKCDFFCIRLAYLGHTVCADGIETDPKKITAIKN